jgi:hypothetical protein
VMKVGASFSNMRGHRSCEMSDSVDFLDFIFLLCRRTRSVKASDE